MTNALEALRLLWSRLADTISIAARATLALPSAVCFLALLILCVFLAIVLLRHPTRRRIILAAVLLLWPFIELALLSGVAIAVLIGALIAALALAVGRTIVALARMTELRRSEELAVSLALGLGVIGGVGLLLATLGWLARAVVASVGAGALVVCLVTQSRRRFDVHRDSVAPPSSLVAAMIAVAAITLEAVTIYVIAPEVNYDSVYYHLTLARDFAASAGTPSIPELWTSNTPILPHVVFAAGTALSTLDAPKVIHFSVGLAVLAAVVAIAMRLRGGRAGALAAILWLASPLVLWEMASAYTDLFIVLWTLGATLTTLMWIQTRRQAYALACGVCIGFGFGVKISMVYVAFPLAMALLVMYIRSRKDLLTWLGSAGIAIGVGAPWYVRSFVLTGNPVFPFYNGVFRSPLWEPVNESFNFAGFGMGQGALDLLLLPWRLTLNTSHFVESADGSLGLLPLLIAAGGVVALVRRARPVLFLASIVLFGTIVWFGTVQYARYLLPTLAIGAAVVAASLVDLLDAPAVPVRVASRIASLSIAVLALPAFVGLMWNVPGSVPWRVDLGITDRPTYLREALRQYRAYEWIDSNIPDAASVRFLGIGLSDWPIAYGPPHIFIGHQTVEGKRVLLAPTEAEVMRQLSANGFRYLIIDEFPRPNPGETSWVIAHDGFAATHFRLLYANNYIYVYSLDPPIAVKGEDVLKDAHFVSLHAEASGSPWQVFGSAPAVGRACSGIEVNPSAGVLQPFDAGGGSLYSLEMVLRGYPESNGFGKLQVNWNGPNAFSSIEIAPVTSDAAVYRMSTTAPLGATSGTVVISGYGAAPVCVTSASLFRESRAP